jgi:hypothetical protein
MTPRPASNSRKRAIRSSLRRQVQMPSYAIMSSSSVEKLLAPSSTKPCARQGVCSLFTSCALS